MHTIYPLSAAEIGEMWLGDSLHDPFGALLEHAVVPTSLLLIQMKSTLDFLSEML